MKVIKRVRRQTPGEKLSHFFLQTGIITKIILPLYTIIAFILIFTSHGSMYQFTGFFSMRVTQILLFIVLGISDIRRQQRKGSFFLILTYLFKNIAIMISHKIIKSLVAGWPEFELLSHTGSIFQSYKVPIQYLFLIMVEDAFEDPEGLKYLFIEPFQLKSKFYPIFFFLILITSLRVDLIVPLLLAILFHFAKVHVFALWVCKRLNTSFLTERMIGLGFIKQESQEKRTKHMDEMATNDSIFYEQK